MKTPTIAVVIYKSIDAKPILFLNPLLCQVKAEPIWQQFEFNQKCSATEIAEQLGLADYDKIEIKDYIFALRSFILICKELDLLASEFCYWCIQPACFSSPPSDASIRTLCDLVRTNFGDYLADGQLACLQSCLPKPEEEILAAGPKVPQGHVKNYSHILLVKKVHLFEVSREVVKESETSSFLLYTTDSFARAILEFAHFVIVHSNGEKT